VRARRQKTPAAFTAGQKSLLKSLPQSATFNPATQHSLFEFGPPLIPNRSRCAAMTASSIGPIYRGVSLIRYRSAKPRGGVLRSLTVSRGKPRMSPWPERVPDLLAKAFVKIGEAAEIIAPAEAIESPLPRAAAHRRGGRAIVQECEEGVG
jgi:hypothetical protein